MDLRGLDPYVDDPPARTNNLYDSGVDGLTMGYDNSLKGPFRNGNISDPLCKTASVFCPGTHVTPDRIIPPRFVQLDLQVDDARNMVDTPTYIQTLKQHQWIAWLLLILVILYFTQW